MITDIDPETPLERAIKSTQATHRAFERMLESQHQLDRALGPFATAMRRLDNLNRVPSLNLVQPLHSPRRERRIELPPPAPERRRPHTAGDPEVEASQAACLRRLRDRWCGG